MNKKSLFWSAFGLVILVFAVIQFVPSAPVLVPAQLPEAERAAHRLLNFEGIANFRDLGGYATEDGKMVKWGRLYRSGNLAKASRSDQQVVKQLKLNTMVDFRSAAEKEEEPDQLPQPVPFQVVEIPTLDGGDNDVSSEIIDRLENGNFEDFDPDAFMVQANRQFASTFTPQYRQFLQTVLEAEGEPVLWHCSAGKDRAGFASALMLRILGVPQEVVFEDYILSREYALAARQKELMLLKLFKGDVAAQKLEILLGVEKPWLAAAFDEIDKNYGDFDNYLSEGLQLSAADIEQLRSTLLE